MEIAATYLKGFLWLFLAILFCSLIGISVTKKNKSFPHYFLNGFILYSLGPAVLGMAVKILQLSFSIFFWGMWVWIGILAAVSAVLIYKKYRWKWISWENFKSFICSYWGLFVILGLLMYIAVLLFPAYWLQNHVDDGFYLSQMASVQYMDIPSQYNPATGLIQNFSLNAYVINTHETEVSFYLSVLGMPAPLFARFFLAAFHYFVLLCGIYAVAEGLFKAANVNNPRLLQWIPMIALFFMCDAFWMRGDWLNVTDSWQFCSAMYYGSSLVRTSGVFLLIYPYLFDQIFDWKVLLRTMGTALVLMAKSTIALPVIYTAAAAYLCVVMLKSKKIWVKLGAPLLIFASALLGTVISTVLPETMEAGREIRYVIGYSLNLAKLSFHFLVSKAAAAAVLSTILLRRSRIWWAVVFTALCFGLLCIPYINSLTVCLSVYDFVFGRAMTAYMYFLLSVGFAALWLWGGLLFKKIGIIPRLAAIAGTGALFGICLNSTLYSAGDPLVLTGSERKQLDLDEALTVLGSNPDLFNRNMVEAGKALTELDGGTGTVNVLGPRLWQTNGVSDYSNVALRSVAPTVKNITAIYRFKDHNDPAYASWGDDQQGTADQFFTEIDDEKDPSGIYWLLQEYPINTFLFKSQSDPALLMESLGFSKYWESGMDESGNRYYIYSHLTGSQNLPNN
ncbi:MAG: hypothetical protein HUJ54_11035 [Erysipelotrichaceae bacterium]|nr:hypothetical protein [Erysipelotrichaceae bacterium]